MIASSTPYIVTYGPVGGSTTTISPIGNTSTITIGGLDLYIPYTFYVTAYNNASPSISSAQSNSITVIPNPVPAPTGISYQAYSSASIEISWYAPTYGNGTYTITGTPAPGSGGVPITATSSSSPYTLTGFSAVEYTYSVTATNDQGYMSAPSAGLVVIPALPSAPTAFQFDGGDGPGLYITPAWPSSNSVTFTWTAPTDVGIPITGYNLVDNQGNSTLVSGATTTSCSLNLINAISSVTIYTTYGPSNLNSTEVGTIVNLSWWGN